MNRGSRVEGTVTLFPSMIMRDGGTSNNHTNKAIWSSSVKHPLRQ
jgi:hypothetical protein